MGKHRKLMSIDSEKCVWANGTAEDVRVFDTSVGKIGGLFCYEHHMTLEKYAMFTKGEQVHVGSLGRARLCQRTRWTLQAASTRLRGRCSS